MHLLLKGKSPIANLHDFVDRHYLKEGERGWEGELLLDIDHDFVFHSNQLSPELNF